MTVYDMVGVNPEELLNPEVGYHAVMAEDRLIGFRSFGPDGQVPGWEYDDSALDTGGGLRPELTGASLRSRGHLDGACVRPRSVRTCRVPGDRRCVQRACAAYGGVARLRAGRLIQG